MNDAKQPAPPTRNLEPGTQNPEPGTQNREPGTRNRRAPARLADWLHSRTGFRSARHVLLDEELPPGTGWFFTLGSVLLALLSVQLLTGAFLTLYYAPTPDHAYDSVVREVR